MYTLPSDTFSTQEGRGLGDSEYASSVAVKPQSVTRFNSVLDAMIANDEQEYFITEEQFRQMKQTPPEQKAILLKTFRSENRERGVHIKEIIC